MKRSTKTIAVGTVLAVGLAAGAVGCTYDHTDRGDQAACRTADHSLHTVKFGVSRSGTVAGQLTITGTWGDASVMKTTTYFAPGNATSDNQWRLYAAGRNGTVNYSGSGSILYNSWIETTRGNCLATGAIYWEGQMF